MKKDANYNNIEDIEAKKAILLPANKIIYNIGGFFLFLGIIFLILFFIYIFAIDKIKKIKFIYHIFNFNTSIGVLFFLYFGIFSLAIFCLLYFTLNKSVHFDHWVIDFSEKKLNSKVIYFTPSKILIGYDLTIKPKDIMEFVEELSNNSTKYTYYYNKTDINRSLIFLTPTKRKPLPIKSVVDIKTDTAWNIIPLGEIVNHEKRTITPICWYLNEQINRKDVLVTMPSTSILISGGTGSGKSVLQNCIIGHISRFPNNFNLFLADIKKVEFGRLRNVQTVKQVGVELDQIEVILRTMREIMLDRYRMMERFGVNNIYDLIDQEVDIIIINDVKYQEDDILNTKTAKPDGMKFELMTAKKIKDHMDKDLNLNISIEIYPKVFKKIDILDECTGKYFPKANVLMIDEMTEVMSGSSFKLVGSISESIASIARLGRAAATHLALATQRPSGNIISSDLKNNIQQSVLLGLFDSGASSLIFDKDISHLCKPKIKGRGFIKTGNDVIEFQSYWTTPEKDFIYNKVNIDNKVEEKIIEVIHEINNVKEIKSMKQNNINATILELKEKLIYEEEINVIKNTDVVNNIHEEEIEKIVLPMLKLNVKNNEIWVDNLNIEVNKANKLNLKINNNKSLGDYKINTTKTTEKKKLKLNAPK